MNWGSLDAFLGMGGYAFYVWGSYALTAVLMAAEVVLVIRRHRAALRELRDGRSRPDAPGQS